MSLTERDIETYIEKNPHNAFGVICANNETLNVVKDEDAQNYLNRRSQGFKILTASVITGAAVFGLGSARLIGSGGFLKGLGVGYLTLMGALVGQKAGQSASYGVQKKQEEIIRRYGDFKRDPKVVAFLLNRGLKNSKTI